MRYRCNFFVIREEHSLHHELVTRLLATRLATLDAIEDASKFEVQRCKTSNLDEFAVSFSFDASEPRAVLEQAIRDALQTFNEERERRLFVPIGTATYQGRTLASLKHFVQEDITADVESHFPTLRNRQATRDK